MMHHFFNNNKFGYKSKTVCAQMNGFVFKSDNIAYIRDVYLQF